MSDPDWKRGPGNGRYVQELGGPGHLCRSRSPDSHCVNGASGGSSGRRAYTSLVPGYWRRYLGSRTMGEGGQMAKDLTEGSASKRVVLLLVGGLVIMLVGVPVLVATVERPLILYILGTLLLITIASGITLFVRVQRNLRHKRAET